MGWMEDYDNELAAIAKKEIAAEDAAWAALPQSEQEKIMREARGAREKKREDMIARGVWVICDEDDEDEDDEDEDVR